MKKIKSYMFLLGLIVASCASNSGINYSENDNNDISNYVSANNEYSDIDSYKPRTMAEREKSSKRWNTARKETRWQEYKGTMVRIEILLGDSDVRSMRLRLMQNADGGYIDGDARSVLSKVADYEMKRVCGRNVESVMIVYDEPSFEVMRPTSYFDYRIESEGVTMREYGFTCVYKK